MYQHRCDVRDQLFKVRQEGHLECLNKSSKAFANLRPQMNHHIIKLRSGPIESFNSSKIVSLGKDQFRH